MAMLEFPSSGTADTHRMLSEAARRRKQGDKEMSRAWTKGARGLRLAPRSASLSKRKDQGWVLKPRKQFDSEASRDRREKGYGRAMAAGSGAAAGGAVYQGGQAGRKAAQGLVLRRRATNQVKRAVGAESFARQARGVSGDILRRKKGEAAARHLYDQAAHGAEKHAAVSRTLAMRSSEKAPVALRAAGAHGLKGAALAGGALALAGGAKAVSTHRQHGGKTYNGWWEHRY